MTGSHEFFNPWIKDPIPSSALKEGLLISLTVFKSSLSREIQSNDEDVGSVLEEKTID